tara:strand:- start:1558 stop:1932 length:375 start_codon:yes stop_codon:yes gene_type:complete
MSDEKQQYRARVERAKAANIAKLQSYKNSDIESGTKELIETMEQNSISRGKVDTNSQAEKIKKITAEKESEKIPENIDVVEEASVRIQVPNEECLSYGRPPKYVIERGIAYAFKKALNVRVIFE